MLSPFSMANSDSHTAWRSQMLLAAEPAFLKKNHLRMVEYLHVSATSSQVDVGEVEYSRFTVYNEVQTTMSITTYYGQIWEKIRRAQHSLHSVH